MKKDKVAIIGFGYVGQGMRKIFPDALLWDPKFFLEVKGEIIDINAVKEEYRREYGDYIATKKEIEEQCGLAIVCVPTPIKGAKSQEADPLGEMAECDTSIVEKTIQEFDVPLFLIKSTVPPGTTERLNFEFPFATIDRKICFSPEFIGESSYYMPPMYPDPLDPMKHDFMIIGGEVKACEEVLSYFIPRLGPTKKYYILGATEAELVKYMFNTWGATKVTFANEWYEICKKFNASYVKVREGFLLNSMTDPMHTAVFEHKRGFAGKCFPKDLSAIIKALESQKYNPTLLKAVWETNKQFVKMNRETKYASTKLYNQSIQENRTSPS